jgi:hypothetical protein
MRRHGRVVLYFRTLNTILIESASVAAFVLRHAYFCLNFKFHRLPEVLPPIKPLIP